MFGRTVETLANFLLTSVELFLFLREDNVFYPDSYRRSIYSGWTFMNRPLPSSKNPHFQNEARCTTFLVKMSFICMRMKNDFHIKGWAPTLVLKQRPRGNSEMAYWSQSEREKYFEWIIMWVNEQQPCSSVFAQISAHILTLAHPYKPHSLHSLLKN